MPFRPESANPLKVLEGGDWSLYVVDLVSYYCGSWSGCLFAHLQLRKPFTYPSCNLINISYHPLGPFPQMYPLIETSSSPRNSPTSQPKINAFALPSKDIFVYAGLIDLVDDDTLLSAVLAHEIAHVTQRHAVENVSD